MDTQIKLDRIYLCSVVFFDIVKYSKQSLEIQTLWKRRFNQYLADAIKECPAADRVILDTGDGAAICFLGDPETAMFCALTLTGEVAQQERGEEAHPFQVRTGINLGPVRLVKDLNGNLNAVGDGINVGQRVMSFAGDNQILVSRSFYEVASSFSERYANLFRYEGVHKDKHVREHTLYELQAPDAARPASVPAAATSGTGTAINDAPLTLAQTATVEVHLTSIIGPMARHLVRNACQRAGSAGALRQALLAFIPSPAEQRVFLEHCEDIFPADATAPDPVPVSAPLATPPARMAFVWDAAVLERACKDLAGHVGPVARLLVDRAAAKTQTRAALYELLAGEIPSPKDREQFLRQA
jgi:class 3 adenylate cyclase